MKRVILLACAIVPVVASVVAWHPASRVNTTVGRQQFSPLTPATQLEVCVQAIAAQSDPAKLATLGTREANPRLKRVIYWLATARAAGYRPEAVIDRSQALNHEAGTPRATLVKASLLRNLKICDGLGLLTPENMERVRHGNSPIISKGSYTGQKAEVDHIIPWAHAPKIGNELANLEILPMSLNRAKRDKVGERQLSQAKKLRDAALLTDAALTEIKARFTPTGTWKYELQEQ